MYRELGRNWVCHRARLFKIWRNRFRNNRRGNWWFGRHSGIRRVIIDDVVKINEDHFWGREIMLGGRDNDLCE